MQSVHLTGISPKIDSCAAMLTQKAQSSHRRLAPGHKRWIDPEDLLQEGLIAALKVEERHDETKGAKFSTLLYKGADWHLSRKAVGLLQEKRSGDPVSMTGVEDTREMEFPVPAMQESVVAPVKAYLALIRALSPPAQMLVIRVMLLDASSQYDVHVYCAVPWGPIIVEHYDPVVLNELQATVRRLELDESVLRLTGLAGGESVRQKVLTELIEDGSLGQDTEEQLRCLLCIECGGQFSLAQVRDGIFYVSSMKCRRCHREQMRDEKACFGKEHDPDDPVCRLHCREKKACKEFKEQSMTATVAVTAEVEQALAGIDFTDIDAQVAKKAKDKPAGKEPKTPVVKPQAKDAKAKAAPKAVAETSKKAVEPTKEKKAKTDGVASPVKGKEKPKTVVAKTEKEPTKKASTSKSVEPKQEKTKTASASKKATDVAASKEPKSKKAASVDEVPVPAAVGSRWPYRNGSCYQWMFQVMYEGAGIKQDKLREKLISEGRASTVSMMIKELRGGHTGTHRWKISEEGGRFRIYDVKERKTYLTRAQLVEKGYRKCI